VFLSDRILIMAPRPGRVLQEITVDAPYPRGLDYRTSPEYAAKARETSEALMTAMGGVLMEGE
jgi:NitT/TauT family transport system ATP-binding protein